MALAGSGRVAPGIARHADRNRGGTDHTAGALRADPSGPIPRRLAICAGEAVPVVPSWWTTSEAAAIANVIASRASAPAASAAARFAVTASPAPTTSIGPRMGSAGTCS